jgi:hypothetical protein
VKKVITKKPVKPMIEKPTKRPGMMYAGGSATFDETAGMKNLKGIVAGKMKTRRAPK